MTHILIQKPQITLNEVTALSGQESKNPMYVVAFLLMVDLMNSVQDSLLTKADALKGFAAQEDSIEDILGKITFIDLPPNADSATIQQINGENKNIANYQQECQQTLVNLRGGGQVLMTQANTQISSMEQDAPGISNILGKIDTIMSLIENLAPGKRKG